MNDCDNHQSVRQEENVFGNDVIPAFTVLINLNSHKLDVFLFLFLSLFKITIVLNSACNVGIHRLNDLCYSVCEDFGERNEGSCRGANLTCWKEK